MNFMKYICYLPFFYKCEVGSRKEVEEGNNKYNYTSANKSTVVPGSQT